MSKSPEATQALRCSFCLKLAPEVDKLIAGPGIGVFICDACVGLCVAILERPGDHEAGDPQLPSWQPLSDQELLGRLPAIASVASQVEGGLQRWVAEARRRQASWADIGGALGISRQSAWERFSPAEPRN